MIVDTVSIMSCTRNPSYLRDTIATIPQDLSIEIFYQGDINEINDITFDKKEIQRFTDPQFVHQNSQYNYAYILQLSKNYLIVEDDIIFSNNFLTHLNYILSDLELFKKEVSERYAVALYSCYRWTDDYTDRVRLCEYPLDSFYGTQAMLYDEYTAKNFGDYLMNNIGVEAYDLALKSYINKVDPSVKLLASTRSIVQHNGQTTSGLGFFHQAANYIDG
jgi:hypothetical protein